MTASITFLDAGSDATYGVEAWPYSLISGAGSAVVSDSSIVRHGPRSIKATANPNLGCAFIGSPSSAAGQSSRMSFGFYFDTIPDIYDCFMETAAANHLQEPFSVIINSSGNLEILSSALAVTGSTVLAINTWYRLTVAWTMTSSTVFTINVYINGILEIAATGANGHTTNSTVSTVVLGINLDLSDNTNSLANYRFDDIYIDNGTTNDDPAGGAGYDLIVTYKAPTSVNDNTWATTNGTGAVNDRPVDTSNGVEDTSPNTNLQDYNIQSAATGDIDISTATILGYGAWVYSKNSAAFSEKIISNGTQNSVTLTTTAAYRATYTTSAAYPSNPATIGMVGDTTSSVTWLYECGMLIAVIVALSVPQTSIGHMMMGCG